MNSRSYKLLDFVIFPNLFNHIFRRHLYSLKFSKKILKLRYEIRQRGNIYHSVIMCSTIFLSIYLNFQLHCNSCHEPRKRMKYKWLYCSSLYYSNCWIMVDSRNIVYLFMLYKTPVINRENINSVIENMRTRKNINVCINIKFTAQNFSCALNNVYCISVREAMEHDL